MMKKLLVCASIWFFCCGAFAPLAFSSERELGFYVVRESGDEFVSDANQFLSHFWGGVSGNGIHWTVEQYYWNEPRAFMEEHLFWANNMDLAFANGHGAPYLVTTLGACCDVIHFEDCPGYGNFSKDGGDLEFLIVEACSPLPAPPDADYADVYNWFQVSDSDATGIFQGLHQLMSFRTGSSGGTTPNYYNEFGKRIAEGNGVMWSWFAALDITRDHHGGGAYPGYGAAITADGLENDTIFDYGPDPPSIHAGGGYIIFWQE